MTVKLFLEVKVGDVALCSDGALLSIRPWPHAPLPGNHVDLD